jgi:hypothetical protein
MDHCGQNEKGRTPGKKPARRQRQRWERYSHKPSSTGDCQDFPGAERAKVDSIWSLGRDHGPTSHFDFIFWPLKL